MSELFNREYFFDFNEKGNESVKKKEHEGLLYRSLCCRTKCNKIWYI